MDVYYLKLVCDQMQLAATDLEKALVYSARGASDSAILFNRIEKLLKNVRSEHDRAAFLISNERDK
jgi:hypothetical protein